MPSPSLLPSLSGEGEEGWSKFASGCLLYVKTKYIIIIQSLWKTKLFMEGKIIF